MSSQNYRFYEIEMVQLAQQARCQLLTEDINTIAVNLTATKAKDIKIYIYRGDARVNTIMPILQSNDPLTCFAIVISCRVTF